ncbi:MAG: PilZ domain-containing protein [Candidatus Aquicultor sp.]
MNMPNKNDPLKPVQEEKRESFRINDTLPVVIRKIETDEIIFTPETFEGDPEEINPLALEKENIPPRLWKMLVNLNIKLDQILERIPVDLIKTKSQPINLSSTGMKVKVKKNFGLDELVRIKMLLPTLPVKELVISGKVVRVKALAGGEYEVALHFHEMDDTVRDEIIHYTLNQQRKSIAAQRQRRCHDESSKEKNL